MPTGYTSFIEDGKVKTAKQFLHLCLRNFGVCINMKDDSLKLTDDYTEDISKGYQEDINYHKRQLTSAEKKLSEIKSISEEELCKKYIKETSDNIQYYLKAEDKRSKNNKKYLEIRSAIEAWDCNPEFQSIKDFALNQIDISMDKGDYYQKAIEKYGEPTREGFQQRKEEYLQKLIDDTQWDVNYHTEELEKAIKRRDDNLKFYNEFKKELNKVK